MQQTENASALQGVKVVELSTFVAAPVCARMLGDLGADVIKVESFQGDPWRATAKACTFTGDDELPVFDIYNAGKKSVRLNIKHEAGMKALMQLLAQADVFITNTRAGSLKKLGLDYESLKEKFPRLIYASITGYGEKGPDAASPGFDNLAFWTRSGFLLDMSVKGEGSYPVYSPTGAGDTFTGTVLFASVLAALYRRERTGHGDFVTAALYNAGIWMFAGMILQTQERYHVKYPKERADCSPFASSYRCADGEWFGITVLDHDRYRATVFRLLGIEEEMAPLNITTQAQMKQLSATVIPIMERAFAQKTSQEWLKLFREADIVCGVLNHMSDVSTDEQALVNGFVQDYTCRNGAVCRMPCPPIRLASQPLPRSEQAPTPGEDTDAVLSALGYTPQQIEQMKQDGAVK